jgi:calcineurin-like phosphoesterase family protein
MLEVDNRMTDYATSDEHYDHRNIIKFCHRPFSSVEEMQREIITRHNSVVKPEDCVLHFGDFSFKERTVPLILPFLNGTHRLIMGNHDSVHVMRKKSEAAIKRYLDYGFKEVVQETRLGMFRCHHFPYEEDGRHGTKYAEWRPEDKGDWLLHGHVHCADRIVGDRQIDCGIDGWDYFPVSLEHLTAITKDPSLVKDNILPKMRPEVHI